MKALITGHKGYIGGNLYNKVKQNYDIAGIDLKGCEISGKLYPGQDLCDGIPIEFYNFKPDVIFHLAALARIQPSFDNPTDTFNVNVNGTINLLNWARLNGNIPLVYAGSSSSHGDKYSNPYTFTKWQGELLCELYNKVYNLPTVVTRFYNVYGEHQILDGAYAAVIGIFEKLYSENKTLTVTGDGEQRRDFTHVEDIVDGLVRCSLNMDVASGKIFELGRGKNYSINEITEMFGEKEVEYIPMRPGEMRVTLCESVEARELLGWNPKIDIKDYIKNWRQSKK